MKTFKQFISERTFSSRKEAEDYYGDNLPYGKDDTTWNNSGSTENPKWRAVSKKNRSLQAQRRKDRITSLTNRSDAEKGKEKIKYIKSRGYDAHHITPTHVSDKVKGKMSDDEWDKKKERDAKGHGIYHGDHPRNIMMAKGKNTPKDAPGVHHRSGIKGDPGAHEIEGKYKSARQKPGEAPVGTLRDIVRFRKRLKEAPTNSDGSNVQNFTPFLFPRDDDLLDQGFQGPAETGMDKWNRFFGVVPVTRMTLKTKLDGVDSIDQMVDASKEYTKVQDDLTDKQRHDKIRRWAFGIRN